MQNASFNGLNKIFKYDENTYGFVTNGTIEVLDNVPIATGEKGQPIYRQVYEILEHRPSTGIFIEGTEIPTWYKLTVH